MKKLLALALVLCFALSFAACSKGAESEDTAAANRLEEIKARGYIEVATEPYWVPMEFIDPSKTGDAQYVGVDIELAKYIADQLGVELRIVPLEFSAVLAGITTGKYDLAISALAYSPARAENMNMSDGYYFGESSGYGLLIRAADAGAITGADSLADKVIVTQSGSVQESLALDQIPASKEFKRVSSMPDGYLMVTEGKADACICDIANAQLYVEANPDAKLAVVQGFKFDVDESMEGTRVGIPLGETELTDFVNGCIETLRGEGKIDAWYSEYADYAKTLGLE
ncbi:MAG: transporter substrate-binding domain-containing protein [Oscillospiraceae bacterium]|nr:transporter substrate-binding domain-containing protein [Oscillospiraceae bacterium]